MSAVNAESDGAGHAPPGRSVPAALPCPVAWPLIARAFRAAIDEAARFVGATAPNPPVGCAILDRHGDILTIAAHHRAGMPHAEALALRQCAEQGLMARAAIAVVTLEPCNHTGRTGPCSEAILASPIRTVWVGVADPNPRVAGGGIDRLRAGGCAVHVLDQGAEPAAACRALIAPFAHWSRTGRAWLTVKQAVDASGSMIPPAGQTTFTSDAALTLAHRLRRATDAIVTGSGTVLADRPGLDVRRVADHADRAPRLLAVCDRKGRVPADWRASAAARGFDVWICDDITRLPEMLGAAGVLWALVEAGPGLLAALRAAGLWDDWLTIGVGPDGTERLDVAVRMGTDTPLRLFPELAASLTAPEGEACFPAS
ncbi:bifunctional diaminohydroxyphosphoribosylaminopyrimidine deaminase/5-amino-6-(5-phosphoribosylamino)uracil reductase RibD [Gluconacetobacter asukensis]|uniref:Riboflavin biosynthesis protein RibD n=1 Tax=Gluconacetobacter asukensis TaxID=1017181 RepID=A0A7W4NYY0_9PROT|nr:bifunctional diaminohydroxyphosphoribosylaminopyrimidine deaminase/5-amino-6-(5-phosphoribosylamino)uracil reductase RibD [Gluconacetobacter asukensis]